MVQHENPIIKLVQKHGKEKWNKDNAINWVSKEIGKEKVKERQFI